MLTRSHSKQVWCQEEGDILVQVSDMLCQGKSKDDIRTFCLSKGQSESEAYFTYMAACIIAGDRIDARTKGRRVA